MAMTDQMYRFAEYVANGVLQGKSAVLSGYSKKSADKIAVRLMKRDDIQAEINRIRNCARVSEVTGDVMPLPTKVEKIAYACEDPRAKLLSLMNCGDEKVEFEAAKILMPYYHAKQGDKGIKEQRREEAVTIASNHFQAMKIPTRKFN